MADKFNRNYTLSIQTNTVENENEIEFIRIEPPFTVVFNIIRTNMSSLNSMSRRIYLCNQLQVLKTGFFTVG